MFFVTLFQDETGYALSLLHTHKRLRVYTHLLNYSFRRMAVRLYSIVSNSFLNSLNVNGLAKIFRFLSRINIVGVA